MGVQFDMPIALLELSIRASNALRRWRPDLTVQDLISITDAELLRIPHMGPRSVKEIREAVRALKLIPRSEPDDLSDWVERHRTLVLALMRGEAVIVPTSVPSEGAA